MAHSKETTRRFSIDSQVISPSQTTLRQENVDIEKSLENLHKEIPANRNQRRAPQKPWTPKSLRRPTLFVFMAFFILMIIVLELLLKISKERQGFDSTNSSKHYLWTYGPTAIPMIVSAFWTLVEYRTKLLQPWKEMAKKPQVASKTVLLDYVSPINLVSLFTSLRATHFAVAIVIAGTFLFQGIIILSSALFDLQSQTIRQQNVSLALTERFDGQQFNLENVNGIPALTVDGVMTHRFLYPPGTNEEYAIPSFNTSKFSPTANFKLVGNVPAISANLSCEVGTLANTSQYCYGRGCEYTQIAASVTSPSCHISKRALGPSFSNAWSQHRGNVWGAQCSNTTAGQDPNRVAVFVGFWNNTLLSSTMLLCKPSYVVGEVRATVTNKQLLVDAERLEASGVLDGFSQWDIAKAVLKSSNSTSFITSTSEYLPGDNSSWLLLDPFLISINASMPKMTWEAFTDPEYLISGAQRTFTAISAQIFKDHLTQPDDGELDGIYIATEQRLVFHEVSLRLLEVALALLLLATGALCFSAPGRACPQDPASIGRIISILARSQQLENTLIGKGHFPSLGLRSSLRGHYFTEGFASLHSSAFTIEEEYPAETMGPETQPLQWWRPLTASKLARILLIILPICLFIPLELLYHYSQRLDGLAFVVPGRYLVYTWTYLPTFIMSLVQLFYYCVDFNIHILEPYHQLMKGTSNARRSIMEKGLSRLTPHSIFLALQNRQYAVALSSLSVLLASALTIAVTGLYTAEPVVANSSINATRLDNFSSFSLDLNWGHFKLESRLSAALIAEVNMSYPMWTSGEYVLPSLSLHPSASENSSVTQNFSSLVVKIPIQRGNLDCEAVPSKFIEAENSNGPWPYIYWRVPTGCSDPRNFSGTVADSVKDLLHDLPANGPWGYWTTQAVGINDTLCPTSTIYYGQVANSSLTELYIVNCYSSIQEVEAEVKFSLPDWTALSVTPDEATVKTIKSGNSSQFQLNKILPYWDPERSNILSPNQSGFDETFQSILRHYPDLEPPTLFQPETTPILISRLQHIYSAVVAQILNGDARESLNNTSRVSIPATGVNTSRLRLKQSRISTSILEGILAAILLCAATVVWSLDLRQVLPKNPCSIGSVASLVAGSELLRIIPEGAEWLDDKELEQQVFNKYYFSLGWWGEEETPTRRFGIDIGELKRAEKRGLYKGLLTRISTLEIPHIHRKKSSWNFFRKS